MDYDEALTWLYARQGLGIKLGLDKVHELLGGLGDPHEDFRAVHVAGTNGKGSVVALLESVLHEAGFRVGATTSPHLVRFPERIRIGGRPVPEADIAHGLSRIRPVAEILDAKDQPPTFFECTTALAFLLFSEAGIDWAIVETGLGGRLDATNVLIPAVTVITDIGLDHQAYLGETLAEVTWEKAGIMKPGVPLVTSASGEALLGLKARSQALEVPMAIIGEDYHVARTPEGMLLSRPTGEAVYRVGLAGTHQHRNAALAVAACDVLARSGVFVPERAVQAGLGQARHPGRIDHRAVDAAVFGGSGTVEVLIDGAHNPQAATALAQHLQEAGWQEVHAVVGFCVDKQWRALAETWAPHVARWHPTVIRNPRTVDAAALEGHFQQPCAGAAAEALRGAVAAGATRILVAGSLFLAGEVLAVLEGQDVEGVRGDQ